jgi:hypothetical protein
VIASSNSGGGAGLPSKKIASCLAKPTLSSAAQRLALIARAMFHSSCEP